jgi:hypothetical protein
MRPPSQFYMLPKSDVFLSETEKTMSEITVKVYEPGYPIWRYHQEKCPAGLIVYSSEQDNSLGDGWVDSPGKFTKEEAPVLQCKYAPEEKPSKEEVPPKEPKEERPATKPKKEKKA